MSNKGQLLQDPFLNTLRKEHVPVSIYLVNGIKLQGQIESFDQYVVLLKNSVTQMVYKHAISTVVPSRPINLGAEAGTTLVLQSATQAGQQNALDVEVRGEVARGEHRVGGKPRFGRDTQRLLEEMVERRALGAV